MTGNIYCNGGSSTGIGGGGAGGRVTVYYSVSGDYHSGFIQSKGTRRMAENGFAPPPPPREFCRHILSCRELKAESFKRCLHSVLRGVSL